MPVSSTRLAGIGLSGSLVAFGFGRFAYGALLPSMRADLSMSYTLAGSLATVNLVAYVLGAVVAGQTVTRIGPHRLLWLSISITAVPLIGLSVVTAYPMMFAFMALLGLVSAGAWIAVVALLTASAPAERRGGLLGMAGLGAGWGIPFVAAIVVFLGMDHDPSRWAVAWLAMGVISTVLGAWAWWGLRGVPQSPVQARPRRRVSMMEDLRSPAARRISLIYALYGFGYSVFVTFVVAFMRNHFSATGSLGMWAILGLAAGLGGLLIGRSSDRWGRRTLLILALIGAGTAAAIPILSPRLPVMLASAIGFGFPMVGVGTVVAAYIGDLLPDPSRSGSLFATATVLFGMGQAIGPAVAGPLIDALDSFEVPFILSSGTLMTAALIASRIPSHVVDLIDDPLPPGPDVAREG